MWRGIEIRAFLYVLGLLGAAASVSSVQLFGNKEELGTKLKELSTQEPTVENEILKLDCKSNDGIHMEERIWKYLTKAQNQHKFVTIQISNISKFTLPYTFSAGVDNMIISLRTPLELTTSSLFKSAFQKQLLTLKGPKSLTILCDRSDLSLAEIMFLGDSVKELTVNVGVKSDFAYFFKLYKSLEIYRLKGVLEAKRVDSKQIVVEFSDQPMSEDSWTQLRKKYPKLRFSVKFADCFGSIQRKPEGSVVSRLSLPSFRKDDASLQRIIDTDTPLQTSRKQTLFPLAESDLEIEGSGSTNPLPKDGNVIQIPHETFLMPSETDLDSGDFVSPNSSLKDEEPRSVFLVPSTPSETDLGSERSRSMNSTPTGDNAAQEPRYTFSSDPLPSTRDLQGSEAPEHCELTETKALDMASRPFQWLKDKPVLHADPVVDLILRLTILIGGCLLLPIIIALFIHRSALASCRAELSRSSKLSRRIKCIGNLR